MGGPAQSKEKTVQRGGDALAGRVLMMNFMKLLKRLPGGASLWGPHTLSRRGGVPSARSDGLVVAGVGWGVGGGGWRVAGWGGWGGVR